MNVASGQATCATEPLPGSAVPALMSQIEAWLQDFYLTDVAQRVRMLTRVRRGAS